MKQFEHEIVSFDLSSKKHISYMEESLRDWGLAGFEIVSAIPSDMHSTSVRVFFKREILASIVKKTEAA